jgi:hypothetical protein
MCEWALRSGLLVLPISSRALTGHQSSQQPARFAQDDNMVDTLATNRSDQSFLPQVQLTLPRHGRPAEPAHLVRHACLTLSRAPGSASWPFQVDGKANPDRC